MADQEKVIKGLTCCRSGCCLSCPYNDGIDDNGNCELKFIDDALTLLKAQEPVKPKKINRYMDFDEDKGWYLPDVYDCGWCGEELPWMLDTAKRQTKHYKPNYCPDCGRKVDWE